MKTNSRHMLLRANGLLLALTLLGGTATQLHAQQGQGAITLMRLSGQLKTRASAQPAAQPMPCPKCKETMVSVRDNQPKGQAARVLVGKQTKVVAQHECAGCGTSWSITGTGRFKHTVATHTCSGCGVANLACCNTVAGSTVATTGMNKHFELAPLK